MQGLVGGKQGGPIDYCLKRVSAIIAVAELLNKCNSCPSERVHRYNTWNESCAPAAAAAAPELTRAPDVDCTCTIDMKTNPNPEALRNISQAFGKDYILHTRCRVLVVRRKNVHLASFI